ncbi:MAG: pyrroline-5-carboxylate reductase [Halobacteriota archaeon]|nr:pyrroline-5-carboxylate reductase [Halobacteriota archaeon]
MTKKIGFIGAGNIGEAIIRSIIKSGLYSPDEIITGDVDESRLRYLKENFDVSVTNKNEEVAKKSKVVILAVKPNHIEEVVSEIGPLMDKDKLIISVAAGIRTERIERDGGRVIRVMPNMACIVGESVSAICRGKFATEEDEVIAREIFITVGKVVTIKEDLMDVVTGFASAPAFVFMIIEALADGGVHEGLDRVTALELAAQTVLGAAKLVLETKKHPEELKDMVTSPGGTTIRGIRVIEEHRVRFALMYAVIEATERSREFGGAKRPKEDASKA